LTLVKTIEIVAALALLTNRFVPLAVVVLAPIIVGIAFFHVVLAPSGMPIAATVLALELVLAWRYRSSYTQLLRSKVTPDPVMPELRAVAAR
jgi:hypothetical protein